MTHMPKRIVVIGGGITGLAAAYRLQRIARERGLPLDITLFEADARLGGKLQTVCEDGFVIEAGPDSFLVSKPQALALCAELGLGERLIGTNETERRTFIYSKGRLHDLPEGFSGLMPGRVGPLMRSGLISPLGKARLLLDLVLPARPLDGDEPVAGFMRRRLGREAFDRLIEPLMSGIYAGDADRLSLVATFPQLRQMELTHGGLLRGVMAAGPRANSSLPNTRSNGTQSNDAQPNGAEPYAGQPKRSQTDGAQANGTQSIEQPPNGERSNAGQRKWTGFVSLRGGMGELVDALEEQLHIEMRTARRVDAIVRGNEGWVVRSEGAAVEADAVLVATPAYATADLVETLDGRLAELHRAIPHGSTATVSLAFRQAELRPPPSGFGFVVPGIERRPLVACTFVSNKFAGRGPDGMCLIRCFIGRVGAEQLLDRNDAELIDVARSELKAILGIDAEPLWARVFRWSHGMPQYNLGHLERVAQIESRLQAQAGLFVAGAAYRGVGIPDCIRSADHVAAKAVRYLFES